MKSLEINGIPSAVEPLPDAHVRRAIEGGDRTGKGVRDGDEPKGGGVVLVDRAADGREHRCELLLLHPPEDQRLRVGDEAQRAPGAEYARAAAFHFRFLNEIEVESISSGGKDDARF